MTKLKNQSRCFVFEILELFIICFLEFAFLIF